MFPLEENRPGASASRGDERLKRVPVSTGCMGYARLQPEPFSLDAVLAELRHDEAGGVNLYVGTVRRHDEGQRVEALDYEAYGPMAAKSLELIRSEAVTRFHLTDAIVIHRHGRLAAGEPILVVACASVHRQQAIDATKHVMDRLKEVVPIWKKEIADATPAWILGKQRRRAVP